jgi:hypothetical protein
VFHFSTIPLAFQTFIHQHFTYLREMDFRGVTLILSMLSVLFTAVAAVLRLRRFYRGAIHQPVELFLTMYLVFSVVFWFVVLVTPILNGSYVGFAILRYNIYAIYLSLFNYGILMMMYLQHQGRFKRMWIVPACLMTLVTSFSLKHIRELPDGGLRKLVHYYPSMVQAMDSLAVKEDLHYGVATYWNAKYITMFSTTGLRVYTVYPELIPWYHVMNEHWYRSGGKGKYGSPAFTFIYMSGMDSTIVSGKLGEPKEVIPFEKSAIWEFPPFVFTSGKQPEFIPDS